MIVRSLIGQMPAWGHQEKRAPCYPATTSRSQSQGLRRLSMISAQNVLPRLSAKEKPVSTLR